MTHARENIRSSVETRVQSLTPTGDSVFAAKTTNLQTTQLPCLLIYTLDEECQPDTTMASSLLTRVLTLVIEGVAKDGDTIFDDLDDIAESVEIAMASDVQFGGKAKDSYLVSTEVDFNSEGDQIFGSIKLTYQFIYRTTTGDPTTNK